jgi:hypothetical protein
MAEPFMSTLGAWSALTFVAATPAAPAIAEIQAAYERAAAETGSTHVEGLKIVGSDCASTNGRYFCQIGFTVANSGDGRVFLDAISLDLGADQRWVLISGLCRR